MKNNVAVYKINKVESQMYFTCQQKNIVKQFKSLRYYTNYKPSKNKCNKDLQAKSFKMYEVKRVIKTSYIHG